MILPNENPSELEEIKNKWLNDPNYDEPLLLTLAEQVAVAEWFYRRALNQYNQTEQHLYELQPDLFSRTPDQIKLLERFQRYLSPPASAPSIGPFPHTSACITIASASTKREISSSRTYTSS
ncbi:MAG TPA: hypothetical protein VLI55_02065 [Bryobacteraceae bacterium]|nr:hypothetical protein [Bryobacteraceae bacterium]